MINWIFLFLAGLSEIVMTFSLGKTKGAEGVVFYSWGALFLVVSVISVYFLSKAVETIPLGTAYPIWTGIGAVGSVLIGIFFFHEPANFLRIFFLTTLIGSIVGLKMIS